MHERRELGPVLVALVGDDREAFKYRLKSLANRARLITQLAEALEVIGDMAIMPGDQDRLDTGEVLVERGASNASFLGDLGHRHSPQPVPRDQGRGRIEDRLVDLSAVRLNRLVPELRDYARIRAGAHRHSIFCVDTLSRCTLHCGNAERNAQSTALEDTHMANPAPSTDAADEIHAGATRESTAYPGTPRWVKVSAIVALILILLIVVVMVLGGGEHNPTRHIPSASGLTHTLRIVAGI